LLGRLTLAAALAVALGACGGETPPARQCPDEAPPACTAASPRFATDAAPIIAGHCAKCHAPGGMAEKAPFETYDQIAPYAGDMRLELETCQMPPPPEPALAPAERQALIAWIACGALDD
jgi:uncharacterized membrane protein